MRKNLFTLWLILGLLIIPAAALAGPFSGSMDKLKTSVGEQYGEATLETTIGDLIKILLSIVGTIFLVLTIYAGVLWMTSQGNEEQVTKATDIIRAAIIGLIITLSAYAITAFVADRLAGNSQTSTSQSCTTNCARGAVCTTNTECASGLCNLNNAQGGVGFPTVGTCN